MKRVLFLICAVVLLAGNAVAQQRSEIGDIGRKYVKYEEYDLDNGLHVIVIPDTSSPIVNIGVMYHVGGKNERADRTGFAHLYEHLMFQGTKNIPQGELETSIENAGGYNNASTSNDRTYYYQILPANQIRLGLWIEAERMANLVITEDGLRREIDVVKEERRQRYDGNPLSVPMFDMMEFEFKKHPYRMPLIGYMEHLDAASLEDVKEFSKMFYAPTNACLVVSGGVDVELLKKDIEYYFGHIARGPEIKRPSYTEKREAKELVLEKSLKGIKEPHIITSYMVAPDGSEESTIFKFAIQLMTDGSESAISTFVKDSTNMASKVTITPEFYEDAGMVWVRASHADSVEYRCVLDKLDLLFAELAEKGFDQIKIDRLKKDYAKDYADVFFAHPSIAEMMAEAHFLKEGGAEFIFNDVDRMSTITNEDLKAVIGKYLVPNNRRVIAYSVEK